MLNYHRAALRGALLASLSLGMSYSAHALVSLGVKGGANLSSFSTSPAPTPAYKSGIGYMGGLGIKAGAGVVGFLADIFYAHRVVGFDGVSTTIAYNSLYIPAQINFGMGPVMLTAGGYYGMVMGNVTAAGVSVAPSSLGMNTTDYGIVGGIGVKLMKFSVEARYNFGLADLAQSSSVSTNTRSIDFVLGYYFM